MKKRVFLLLALNNLLLAHAALLPIANFTRTVQRKSHSWHATAQQKPTERLNKNFVPFLRDFLDNTQTMSEADELAQTLITLNFVRHSRPEKFKEYQLKPLFDECFKQIEELSIPKKAHLFELQPYCDFWYFSKLLKRETVFEIEYKLLQKHLKPAAFKKVKEPSKALVYWIYLENLDYCDPKQYKSLQPYKKQLENLIKQDKEMYGYFLTLTLFYQTNFGHKKQTKATKKTIKLIKEYCSTADLKDLPLDLLSHIFICLKLYNEVNTPLANKIASILTDSLPSDFQEVCYLLAAAA